MKPALVCAFLAGINLPCCLYNVWQGHPVVAAINGAAMGWCLMVAWAHYRLGMAKCD